MPRRTGGSLGIWIFAVLVVGALWVALTGQVLQLIPLLLALGIAALAVKALAGPRRKRR